MDENKISADENILSADENISSTNEKVSSTDKNISACDLMISAGAKNVFPNDYLNKLTGGFSRLPAFRGN